jgi:hypothetical protein
MSAAVDTQRSGRFIEWWSYIGIAASALLFLTFIFSGLFQKTLIFRKITASEGVPVKLEPLKLQPTAIGALRIDAEALIQPQQWVTFEIQLLDKQGKVIAAGIKEAWSESGTWYEEGESGSWLELDRLGSLDIRAKQLEDITIAINVLGYGNSSGADLNQPVPFQVTVQNGVIDGDHLFWASLWSLCLGTLSLVLTPKIGKKVISEEIKDSDPTGRGTVGGANKLLRVNVDVESDETSPRTLEVQLFINDAYGEQIYAESFLLGVKFHRSDGKFEKATCSLQKFFILDNQASYGFHVEVLPDEPVDKTRITVREDARTLRPVDIVRISSH